MVSVSDNFKRLSQQNGRRVFCRIQAGGVTFLDDRIIEFDFNDTAQPNCFTVGTACANRFSFSVLYNGELEVRDTVRPFISFDGEEWCPLGVFFVSRRYVRGRYASIICYDAMYFMNADYSCALTLPTTAGRLLVDVCAQAGITIESGEQLSSAVITDVPTDRSCIEMIEYIAAMSGACAKLNRFGKLCLKRPADCGFVLDAGNCMSISKNMGVSSITCVKVDTGSGTLVAGSGSKLNTVRFYCPMMTQSILGGISGALTSVSFYGAEIEMQGLPFLEAGEMLRLNDGSSFDLLSISEVEYHYNGTFTAVLRSNNADDYIGEMTNEELLKALSELRESCVKRENADGMTLSGASTVTAAAFNFKLQSPTYAKVDVSAMVNSETAEQITLKLVANGVTVKVFTAQVTPSKTSLVSFSYPIELPAGRNRVYVTASVGAGRAAVNAGNLTAALYAHGLSE